MLCDCVTRGCGDHSPLTTAAILEWRRKSVYILFIGALKGGFVIERSELGSCRAFRVQYPIFKEVEALYWN